MRVKFFSNFCTSEQCAANYKNVLGEFFNQNVIAVQNDDDNYDFAVILNTTIPTEEKFYSLDKKCVIGLAFEPQPYLDFNNFINFAEKYISRYFIGDASNLPPPFEEHYSYMWHKWFSAGYKENKPNKISLMVSDKIALPGNQYRYQLADQIIRQNLPIDIWGRGCRNLISCYGHKPQIKGEFNNTELYDDYTFSIAIENSVSQAYITEKYMDCIMTNTIPIYLGAKKANEIVGGGIYLCGNINKDLEMLKDIILFPEKYKLNVLEIRDKVKTSPELNFSHFLNIYKNNIQN